MRVPVRLASLAAGVAVCICAAVVTSPAAFADDARSAPSAPCRSSDPSKPPAHTAKPKFAEANATLDENDEIAALEAIRVALTEVGDGATYVWHRRHGRLSGIVRPTASFMDPAGRVCRHIVLIMTVGTATGRAEGIACRLEYGRWQLDG
jgi:hypothetical protein